MAGRTIRIVHVNFRLQQLKRDLVFFYKLLLKLFRCFFFFCFFFFYRYIVCVCVCVCIFAVWCENKPTNQPIEYDFTSEVHHQTHWNCLLHQRTIRFTYVTYYISVNIFPFVWMYTLKGLRKKWSFNSNIWKENMFFFIRIFKGL